MHVRSYFLLANIYNEYARWKLQHIWSMTALKHNRGALTSDAKGHVPLPTPPQVFFGLPNYDKVCRIRELWFYVTNMCISRVERKTSVTQMVVFPQT